MNYNKNFFGFTLDEIKICKGSERKALLLNYLKVIIKSSHAQGIFFFDNKHWAAMSFSRIRKQRFPFLSIDQLKHALNNMVSEGILLKDKILVTGAENEICRWTIKDDDLYYSLVGKDDDEDESDITQGVEGIYPTRGKFTPPGVKVLLENKIENKIEKKDDCVQHDTEKEKPSGSHQLFFDEAVEIYNTKIKDTNCKPFNKYAFSNPMVIMKALNDLNMNIDEFQSYIDKALSYKFLRDGSPEGWRVSLPWLLDKNNMGKIFNDSYKEREQAIDIDDTVNNINLLIRQYGRTGGAEAIKHLNEIELKVVDSYAGWSYMYNEVNSNPYALKARVKKTVHEL